MQPALDRLGAVAGLRDHAQVRLALEHEPQPAADDGVVVGEHDPGVEVSGHRGRQLEGDTRAAERARREPQRRADQHRALAHPADAAALSGAARKPGAVVVDLERRAPADELEPDLGAPGAARGGRRS